jgi:N-sulfoglucosamine sulfohydrolase
VVPASPAAAYHAHLELYDLTNDPWEQVNVADNPCYESLRNQLAARLYQHMVQTGDPLLQGAVTCPQHTQTLDVLRGAAR